MNNNLAEDYSHLKAVKIGQEHCSSLQFIYPFVSKCFNFICTWIL